MSGTMVVKLMLREEADRELYGELAEVPSRQRAGRLRTLMLLGLHNKSRSQGGVAAAGKAVLTGERLDVVQGAEPGEGGRVVESAGPPMQRVPPKGRLGRLM